MAYTPNVWKDGDVITADKLNALENGVKNEQVGPKGDAGSAGAKGDPGAAGVSVTAIALTTDASGKVTGGKATLSDKSTLDITVTAATA